MTVTARALGSKSDVVFLKGATEVVLAKCIGLAEEAKLEIHREANKCASKGLRVLSMATAVGDSEKYKYAGFVAMADPPRKGVENAIAGLHSCGVRVRVSRFSSRSSG
jgi:magnesium-transporting ATPase (P-type)